MTATKDQFFKPTKMSAQDKASAIDHAAWQIIDKEAEQRALKTDRLRKLREAQEALAPAAPAPRAKAKRG
ncbi:hypothetical protein SAMN05421890_1892 [Ensifer adhaerens]|nr:hypothetical protein SAMN05421890_1892 [Ensifer adhaerens]HZG28968.1 hypothetical protein [Ensifer sp.]